MKSYRPTRLDHFPNTKPKPQHSEDRVTGALRKRQPFPGSGDTLKMWMEDHGLVHDGKHHDVNVRRMMKATGGSIYGV